MLTVILTTHTFHSVCVYVCVPYYTVRPTMVNSNRRHIGHIVAAVAAVVVVAAYFAACIITEKRFKLATYNIVYRTHLSLTFVY